MYKIVIKGTVTDGAKNVKATQNFGNITLSDLPDSYVKNFANSFLELVAFTNPTAERQKIDPIALS